MNKIRIIDLLNKITNGEEVPKKIKYEDKIYEWKEYDCGYQKKKKIDWVKQWGYVAELNRTYFYLDHCFKDLNDEVEILEEEPRDIEVCGSLFTKSEYDKLAHSEEEKKIPEKLFFTHISNYNDQSVVNNNFNNYFKKTQETINQLIDYLKSKGE